MSSKNGIEICQECEKTIIENSLLGRVNLEFLRQKGKLKIVPKQDCQRCRSLKEKGAE